MSEGVFVFFAHYSNPRCSREKVKELEVLDKMGGYNV